MVFVSSGQGTLDQILIFVDEDNLDSFKDYYVSFNSNQLKILGDFTHLINTFTCMFICVLEIDNINIKCGAILITQN